MATAGSSRLKPRTVTSEKEIGPKPSPGKFTVTPFWLVPSPGSVPSNGRGEEYGITSHQHYPAHFHIRKNLKTTEQTSHTMADAVKDEKGVPAAHRCLYSSSLLPSHPSLLSSFVVGQPANDLADNGSQETRFNYSSGHDWAREPERAGDRGKNSSEAEVLDGVEFSEVNFSS
ncbi:unnamed protein product [Pleuronectes platessa]|uniref:Uncharacterized protein n=1 Tax=Pleuronectes platessa TaxID=8262 RepID=A0A9N7UWJ8_PLEPL|nr:unnamed protein product [Pleuronectes platessa]